MNVLLTIVVPVYKVEAYVAKCLDSVIVRPDLMGKIDVLIINDGTPDRSAEISREYVNRFPGTFRQIDKQNGGHGSVWNLGVKEAYGKYVKFLDSDDWLENLDVIVEKLDSIDEDLVLTPDISHCPNDQIWKLEIKDMEFGRVYDADKFDWLGNRSHCNYILHHCAIYKTEMFRQYLPLFLENQPYDDVILGAAPIIGAKTLVAWDMVFYHYLMDRPGQSISAEAQKKNVAAKIKVQKSTIEFIEDHPITDQTSTKYLYFKHKLPRYYNFGYKSLYCILPYRELRTVIKEWDSFAKERGTSIRTIWMRLYRMLPFFAYYLCVAGFYKSVDIKKKLR